ncbi:DUF4252 domain-containing protein [Aquiflexum sp. LQ15W]|uniref:DUF4252 domain-containing protein n=1 Tax=Cognataquiflexum nitidum TaxID=2922272 RepID=UPI001F1455B6|nr:DUF4252 domain-containing protein [Cognataquiflexum nitidum]MCH6198492.1 DUF4252 domain-containing protein [Cognataquiflexum nitidum]
MIKKILPLIVLTLLVTGANAQDDAISKFFSKYMEDENFSRVYISPKMMQMAGGFLKSASKDLDQEAEDLGELISKVRGIRILSTDTPNGKNLYQEAMATLNKNRYEDLMDVADKGSNVKFMVREENGLVKELLMISGSGESFTLLSMLGSFTYQDLNILAEKTNMPGMKEYQSGNKKK